MGFWISFSLKAWNKVCCSHKLMIFSCLYNNIKYISNSQLWFFLHVLQKVLANKLLNVTTEVEENKHRQTEQINYSLVHFHSLIVYNCTLANYCTHAFRESFKDWKKCQMLNGGDIRLWDIRQVMNRGMFVYRPFSFLLLVIGFRIKNL